MYWGVQDSTDSLAGGMYSGHYSNGIGFYLDKKANLTDGLIHLPDSASDAVLREINEFAELKGEFLSRKMVYKRGIFLWGPPGSGKTSTLAQIVDIVIGKMNGIAFMVEDPSVAIECLKLIRRVEPHRQIVALFEDMDALIQMYGEAKYLSLLDGENQVDNIIYVATTNYPERIDKRFINRPSRFDTVIKVGMPTASARAIYLKHREPSLTATEVDQYVMLSEGFSLAHLREFIILTRVFKRDVQWAATKLRTMMNISISSDKENAREFGFTSGKQSTGPDVIEMPRRAEG
jgi:AAA+ superfamily predicted ATPase